MSLYLWLHGCPYTRPFSDLGKYVNPFNLHSIEGEPIHVGPASNTGLSAAGDTPEAARISTLVKSIKRAKREDRLADAEHELLQELDRQEARAQADGSGVSPWYYEQLAIIYAKQKRNADEVAVLQRYDRQPKAPGAMPAQLRNRLEKAVIRYGTAIPSSAAISTTWSLPHATRKRVARALAMLRNKRVEMPAQKHDNLPV